MKLLKTLLLACILFSATSLNAQEADSIPIQKSRHNNEVNISFGVLGTQDIFSLIYSFGPFFFDPFAFRIDYLNSTSGIAGISYSRYLGKDKKVRLSGIFNFERARFAVANPAGIIVGKNFNLDYYTLMIRGDWFYFQQEYVALYSGLALGGTLVVSEKDPLYGSQDLALGLIAYQVNAIGLRLGYRLAAFTEIGFGAQGILRAGLSFRF